MALDRDLDSDEQQRKTAAAAAAATDNGLKTSQQSLPQPPAKRRRTQQTATGDRIVKTHTLRSSTKNALRIRPLGNRWLDASLPDFVDARMTGLGMLALLSDEILMNAVFPHFDATDLCLLSQVSKALYVWCHTDSLWRTLVIDRFGGRFDFQSDWRSTYAHSHMMSRIRSTHSALASSDSSDSSSSNSTFFIEPPPSALEKLALPTMYSDILYQPIMCASLDLEALLLKVDNIERASRPSLQEFVERFERPNRPVLLTDVSTEWPAFSKWSNEYLLSRFADVVFRVEAVDMTLRDFCRYSAATVEEAPLYLFDKNFCERTGMAGDFCIPEYFSEDLFSVLGNERPDHRWLIMGGKGSGSTFHIDPNATSAWNAPLVGRKKWIMFPPGQAPPGIFPSPDGSEVTGPVSAVDWIVNFYAESRKLNPIEAVCHPGEIMFVPSGWWHLVLNMDDANIAITQNYVSSQNLGRVLTFLKNKPDQVSGCSCNMSGSLYDRFREALSQARPELLAAVESSDGLGGAVANSSNNLGNPSSSSSSFSSSSSEAVKSNMWRHVKSSELESCASSGFQFSFNFDE